MLTLLWVAFKVSAILAAGGYAFAWLLRPAEARWIKSRALPVMIGFYVAGMVLPHVYLYYLLMFAVTPLLARSRGEAAALYLITIFSAPTVATELGAGGVYWLRLDKWLMAALGLGAAVMMHPARGPKARGWFDLPFLAVIICEIVQARGSNFTSVLRIELNILLAFILPYFAVSRSLRRPEDVRRFLTALTFTGFALSFIAVYESRTNFLVYDAIQQHLGAFGGPSSYTHQRSGFLRAGGPYVEATSFGLFLTAALLGTLPLRDIFRGHRYWVGAMAMIGVGLYAANARAAAASFVIGLLAYDLYRRRYQSLTIKCGLLGILVMVALLIAQFSQRFAERIGVGGGSVDTADYRQQLVTRGIEEIRKHPIFGVDPDVALLELADLRQGEGIIDFVNAYIYFGMTVGVGGILLLLFCFLSSGAKAMGNRRFLQRNARWVEMDAFVFAVSMYTILTTYTSGFGGRNGVFFYLILAVGSAISTWRYLKLADGTPAPAARRPEPAEPRLEPALG